VFARIIGGHLGPGGDPQASRTTPSGLQASGAPLDSITPSYLYAKETAHAAAWLWWLARPASVASVAHANGRSVVCRTLIGGRYLIGIR
jgi:hypothetical protein